MAQKYGRAAGTHRQAEAQNTAQTEATAKTVERELREISAEEARHEVPTDYQMDEKVWKLLDKKYGKNHTPTLLEILEAHEELGLVWEVWETNSFGGIVGRYFLVLAKETTEETTEETEEITETTETQETETKKETKKSKTKTQKEERKMETKKMTVGQRANRVVIRTESDGYTAEFYKTHKSIAVVHSGDTSWTANKEHNPTQRREDFRTWVQANASEFGVAWLPELQQQAWDRKYWKYETDEQVEEDAIELMGWTIRSICEKVGLEVEIGNIVLDSIVPMDSPLSYVEHGKYTKNGNWAVAQVNLDVTATIEGTEINLIYPIEMRSGQLTKIKLTKQEIEMMVEDSKVA